MVSLCLRLSPAVDSFHLRDDPCGCDAVVHGELGARGGCGYAANGSGDSLDWPCAPVTSSSSGLECCWLASGPCWTAPPRSPATQPSDTNNMLRLERAGHETPHKRQGGKGWRGTSE